MAPPRKPREPRKPRVPRTPGAYHATGAVVGAGGGELREAAMEIARDAQLRASSWSRSVPASMSVEGDEKLVTVSFDAPAAYPAETRARHPLFGNRRHWYGPPGARFLRPALEARIDPAMRKYAKVIDRLARERGFAQ